MNNESKTNKAAEIKYQLVCAFEESKPMFSYPQKTQKSISRRYPSFANGRQLIEFIKENISKPGFDIINIKERKPGMRVAHHTFQNITYRKLKWFLKLACKD